METQNNEIKETKEKTYTKRDIIKTLLVLDDETRDYITRMEFSQIENMVNNEENLNAVYQMCTNYIVEYTNMGNAIEKFMKLLKVQKERGMGGFVLDLFAEYGSLSEEEKVDFLGSYVGTEILDRSINGKLHEQVKKDFSKINL